MVDHLLTVDSIRAEDREWKPAKLDQDSKLLAAHYWDEAREHTTGRLRALGLGIPDDDRPIEVGLLSRLVERLAVIYDKPAERHVDGASAAQSKVIDRHFKLARYDQAWQAIDHARALYRQAVVFVQPVDRLGHAEIKIFAPHQVLRAPSEDAPDRIELDRGFALCMRDDVFLVWQYREDGWWYQKQDRTGRGYAPPAKSPYARLPVHIVYDQFSGGRAWLPPRSSRLAVIERLNLHANDLSALTAAQLHAILTVSTDAPAEALPREMGPDKLLKIPSDATMQALSPNPAVADGISNVELIIRLLVLSESLPLAEFDPNQRIDTGAAWIAQQAALLQRRKKHMLMVPHDEQSVYDALVAVTNRHYDLHRLDAKSRWAQNGPLVSGDISVSIGPPEAPRNATEAADVATREIELGASSVIDYIQAKLHITRAAAIREYERIAEDREQYAVAPIFGAITETPPSPDNPTPMSTLGGEAQPETKAVAAGAVSTAQDTALNGAQVTSLLTVVQEVSAGAIPREAGARLIVRAFQMSPAEADALLGSAGKDFKPTLPQWEAPAQ